MRKSIATVSLSAMLREKLEAIAAARFDGVEIFENDLLQFAGTPRDVRRIAEDLGLAIDLFQPFRDFEGVDDAQLRRNLDRAERKFDLMQELGAPLMLVCSHVSPDPAADHERMAEQLRMMAERAGRRGLRIGYEALAWGGAVNRFAQAWDVVRRADHPHLGLILDSFHTLALRDDPAPIADLPGDRIFYVQLADAPRLQMDVLSYSRHYRCFPGQGELDVAGFVAAVLDAGYTGPLSLEVFNDDFRATPARPTAGDAMRSLLWLEERVRALPPRPRPARAAASADAPGVAAADPAETATAPAGAAARAPAARRVPLFDPPPLPRLHGWSFVEFAVAQGSDVRLRALLEVLGFARIGRHRSKQVELWGQGDVRFVLNGEEDSFAHAYYGMHGPSVCAVALATDDATAALARAEALGCSRVAGRVGPNELTIPAVRAPDGSLLYFFDLQHGGPHGFETDFLIEREPSADAPLGAHARVDHIAQVVPVGHVDAHVLFHRAVLGLEPRPSVVLSDPYGLIRARAVESPDRAVRYSLNASDRHDTAAARSVSTFAGAGVHHLAIAVGDALAAARALRACGAPILPVPANYHDDLAARYGLDDAFVAELRANDLFYERTADGEFLHLYTTPFDDRFFFEVIERRGGYDGYGAINAPVRLAALAQWRAAREREGGR